ncbi:Bifunctional endo-1,4-beta-xylanase [Melia azedarach]|uniref:Bifunctional endo-1,4-beta-xylanase n=1 Tax=Melia azedarach TaxID=155640 RepID=A0ACC1YLF4_MELAZ|nr:Bifunctional endo-1,4-beta-xylanase [Melia azedarach]
MAANCSGCCRRNRREVASQKPAAARSAPTWERRFCWEVGRVPWARVKNTKKYMLDSDPVVRWNASAAKKSFNKAKHRYWLKINGLPLKINDLPSPDRYIKKIDWDNPNNDTVDSELLQDLKKAPAVKKEAEKVGKCFEVALDQIKPTGWDCDDFEVFDWRNGCLTGMVVGE